MVHIGDTEKRYDPTVIRKLLPLLEQGDILTHYFTANPGGVLDGNGKLVPEAREAADRGVWFDTAHGRMNFSFDVGRRIIEQGLLPHCISTDLTVPGRLMTVHSMTEIMTRFLGLGFTLPQVVTMSTANPAKAIGADERLGSLRVGRQADISVLELRDGAWEVFDVLGTGMRVNRPWSRPDGEARPSVHARLGAEAMGMGARSRAARGRGLGRLLLKAARAERARTPVRPGAGQVHQDFPADARVGDGGRELSAGVPAGRPRPGPASTSSQCGRGRSRGRRPPGAAHRARSTRPGRRRPARASPRRSHSG